MRLFRGKTDAIIISRTDKRVKKVGQGCSADAELYSTHSGQLYVIKVYHNREQYETKSEYRTRVLHEYDMICTFDHLNIIKAFKSSVSSVSSRIKIYLEAGSRDLAALMKQTPSSKVSTHEILCLWKQICNGIAYIHEMGYCHRDLKPPNVVLDPRTGYVKIIDWATAVKVDASNMAVGLVGTNGYAAPETFSSIRYDGKKADVWSIGLILYYLHHRTLPWKSAQLNDPDYYRYCESPQSLLEDLAAEGGAGPSQTLQSDPAARVTIDHLATTPWFAAIASCTQTTQCGVDHCATFSLGY